jgi:hypothetical protein
MRDENTNEEEEEEEEEEKDVLHIKRLPVILVVIS